MGRLSFWVIGLSSVVQFFLILLNVTLDGLTSSIVLTLPVFGITVIFGGAAYLVNKSTYRENRRILMDRVSKGSYTFPDTYEEFTKELSTHESSPPSTDVIYGWRAFKIIHGPRLQGQYGAVWEGGTLIAECNQWENVAKIYPKGSITAQSLSRIHLANPSQCRCGIYSLKVLSEFGDYVHNYCSPTSECGEATEISVMALCSLYGIVNEYENGFISEKSTIVKMWILSPTQCEDPSHEMFAKSEDKTFVFCTGKDSHAYTVENLAYDLQTFYEAPCEIISGEEFKDKFEENIPK